MIRVVQSTVLDWRYSLRHYDSVDRCRSLLFHEIPSTGAKDAEPVSIKVELLEIAILEMMPVSGGGNEDR